MNKFLCRFFFIFKCCLLLNHNVCYTMVYIYILNVFVIFCDILYIDFMLYILSKLKGQSKNELKWNPFVYKNQAMICIIYCTCNITWKIRNKNNVLIYFNMLKSVLQLELIRFFFKQGCEIVLFIKFQSKI